MRRINREGTDVTNSPELWKDSDIEVVRSRDWKLYFRQAVGLWIESDSPSIAELLGKLKSADKNANKTPG